MSKLNAEQRKVYEDQIAELKKGQAEIDATTDEEWEDIKNRTARAEIKIMDWAYEEVRQDRDNSGRLARQSASDAKHYEEKSTRGARAGGERKAKDGAHLRKSVDRAFDEIKRRQPELVSRYYENKVRGNRAALARALATDGRSQKHGENYLDTHRKR